MNGEDFQKYYEKHKTSIEKRLTIIGDTKEPRSVYEPIRYVIGAGGKRVRSVLVILSCEAVGGKARRALDAAAAIEVLHNFTLVHDDVMDNAMVRRGKPTVHRKWDTNVAILTGDEMVALAYRSLLKTETQRKQQVLHVFTEAFIQVCEGQGLDKEFECSNDVALDDYSLMIRKKTGRVIAAATEIGALIGGGTPRQVAALRSFGEYLGRAFQIQDDLLDIVGNEQEFGKTIGGDIIEGKKTFLLLKAFERAQGKDLKLLRSIVPGKVRTKADVHRVREIYERDGILEEAEHEIARSTSNAQRSLAHLKSSRAKETLLWLSRRLLERNS